MELSIWEEIRDRLNLPALGKPAIIGLAALLTMVAVFAGKNIIDTATASEFQIEHSGSSASSELSGEEPTSIFVHVSGSVKNPGLVELPSGSRVADAVEKAGGFNEDARTDSVNLARALQDGEQLYVSPLLNGSGNDEASVQGLGETAGSTLYTNGAETPAEGGQVASSGKVNLNTATEAELETLPGIGPATAAKIVDDRAANGMFSSVDDLLRVSGIGEKKLASLSGLVCV